MQVCRFYALLSESESQNQLCERFKNGHSTSSGPGVHTSPPPILIKFNQLLQLPFKFGSVKFHRQIINGWCTIITNEWEIFVAEAFFTINSQV